MKRLTAFVFVLGVVGALTAGAEAGVTLKAPPKIAFLYTGSIHDGGWTEAQDRARLLLQKEFQQDIPYVENLESADKVTQAAETMIAGGANILIGSAPGDSDAFLAEAKAHPDLAFITPGGQTSAPNLESLNVKSFEGWYLAGLVAANATRSKMLGIIGCFPDGEGLWDVNAFALGAKRVNQRIVVLAAFAKSLDDTGKEAQLAARMLDQGADVIASDMHLPSAVAEAEKAGRFSIGYPNDTTAKGSLASVVLDWGAVLVPLVKRIAAGGWTSGGVTWHGIKEGMLDLTRPSEVISPVSLIKIATVRQEIIDGTLSPFAGPITTKDGVVRVADGQVLSIEQALKMDFLVDNVRGSLK